MFQALSLAGMDFCRVILEERIMTEKVKTAKPTVPPSVKSKTVVQPNPAQKSKVVKAVKPSVQVKAVATKQKTAPASDVAKPAKSAKTEKPAKQKMIRDSFSLPEKDYANFGVLKAKCLENGVEIKKSELIRAGLIALTKMPVATLVKAVSAVERLKTGRPKNG